MIQANPLPDPATTVGRVTYPQYGVGGANIFWPVGDIFPLQPSWRELNSYESLTANLSDEETVVVDLVIPWGEEHHVTLTLVDVGLLLDDIIDDTVPTGFVAVRSRIWRDWGWTGKELKWSSEAILDEFDVWTGEVDVWIPAAMHEAIGDRVQWRYSIDVILSDITLVNTTVRSMMGSLVVRR